MEKKKRTHHGLFAEVTVDASHFVLVHLVQLGMNLKTETLFNLLSSNCFSLAPLKVLLIRHCQVMTSPLCSYPLLGVDDVLPQQLLGNRGHVGGVGQNHLLQDRAALFGARVMLDVRADHKTSQHLVLVRNKAKHTWSEPRGEINSVMC